jgi:hypothetical protein
VAYHKSRKEVISTSPRTRRRVYVVHLEHIRFVVPDPSLNPNSALTPVDNQSKSGYMTIDSGTSPVMAPKVEEGAEDDIPISIRKSFKELRSLKDEFHVQYQS